MAVMDDGDAVSLILETTGHVGSHATDPNDSDAFLLFALCCG